MGEEPGCRDYRVWWFQDNFYNYNLLSFILTVLSFCFSFKWIMLLLLYVSGGKWKSVKREEEKETLFRTMDREQWHSETSIIQTFAAECSGLSFKTGHNSRPCCFNFVIEYDITSKADITFMAIGLMINCMFGPVAAHVITGLFTVWELNF